MNFELELPTTAILVSAVLHSKQYSGAQRRDYLLNPLTMLLIVVTGLRLLPEELGWYHFTLLLGLLFPIGGYMAKMWPQDKYLQGLVFFLTGHLFYILGQNSGIEWTSTWVVWSTLLFIGGGMSLVLRSGLGKMKAPVLVYILVILIMSGLARGTYQQLELPKTLFTEYGAILLLISDAMLA